MTSDEKRLQQLMSKPGRIFSSRFTFEELLEIEAIQERQAKVREYCVLMFGWDPTSDSN